MHKHYEAGIRYVMPPFRNRREPIRVHKACHVRDVSKRPICHGARAPVLPGCRFMHRHHVACVTVRPSYCILNRFQLWFIFRICG